MSSEQRAFLRKSGVGRVIDRILVDVVVQQPSQPYRFIVQRLREEEQLQEERHEQQASLKRTPLRYRRPHHQAPGTAAAVPNGPASRFKRGARAKPGSQEPDDMGALEGFGIGDSDDAEESLDPHAPSSDAPDTTPRSDASGGSPLAVDALPLADPTTPDDPTPNPAATTATTTPAAQAGSSSAEATPRSRRRSTARRRRAASTSLVPPGGDALLSGSGGIGPAARTAPRRVTITQLYKTRAEGARAGRSLMKQYDPHAGRAQQDKHFKFNTRGYHSRAEQTAISEALRGHGTRWIYHDVVASACRDPATAQLLSEPFFLHKISGPLALRSAGSPLDLPSLLDELLYNDLLLEVARATAPAATTPAATPVHPDTASCGFIAALSEASASYLVEAFPQGFPDGGSGGDKAPGEDLPGTGAGGLYARGHFAQLHPAGGGAVPGAPLTYAAPLPPPHAGLRFVARGGSDADAPPPLLWEHTAGMQCIVAMRVFFEVADVLPPQHSGQGPGKAFMHDVAEHLKRNATGSALMSRVPLWRYPLVLALISARFHDAYPGEDWTVWVAAEAMGAGGAGGGGGGGTRLSRAEALMTHTNLFFILWAHMWRLASVAPVSTETVTPIAAYCDTDVSDVVERTLQCRDALLRAVSAELGSGDDGSDSNANDSTPLLQRLLACLASVPQAPPLRLDWLRVGRRGGGGGGAPPDTSQRLLWNTQIVARTGLVRRLLLLQALVASGMPWCGEAQHPPAMLEAKRFWEAHFGVHKPAVPTDTFRDAFASTYLSGTAGDAVGRALQQAWPDTDVTALLRSGRAEAATPPPADSPGGGVQAPEAEAEAAEVAAFLQDHPDDLQGGPGGSAACALTMLLHFLDYFGNGTCLVTQFATAMACLAPEAGQQGSATPALLACRALSELAAVMSQQVLVATASDTLSHDIATVTLHQMASPPADLAFVLRGGPRAHATLRRAAGVWRIDKFPLQPCLSAMLAAYLGTQGRGGDRFGRTPQHAVRHAVQAAATAAKSLGSAGGEPGAAAAELLLLYRPASGVQDAKAMCRLLAEGSGSSAAAERLALVGAHLAVHGTLPAGLPEPCLVEALRTAWGHVQHVRARHGRGGGGGSALQDPASPLCSVAQAAAEGASFEDFLFCRAHALSGAAAALGGARAFAAALAAAAAGGGDGEAPGTAAVDGEEASQQGAVQPEGQKQAKKKRPG